MSQTQRLGTVATNIRTEGNFTIIRYHDTDVVKFTPEVIVLDNGGWQTATTKTRMNQASNQFGLDYTVKQKGFSWSVEYKGKIHQFKNDKCFLSR
jgi:hypothetical protein